MLELENEPAERARGVLYRRGHRIAMLYGDEGQLDVELADALGPEGVSYTASGVDGASGGESEGPPHPTRSKAARMNRTEHVRPATPGVFTGPIPFFYSPLTRTDSPALPVNPLQSI